MSNRKVKSSTVLIVSFSFRRSAGLPNFIKAPHGMSTVTTHTQEQQRVTEEKKEKERMEEHTARDTTTRTQPLQASQQKPITPQSTSMYLYCQQVSTKQQTTETSQTQSHAQTHTQTYTQTHTQA